MCSRWWQRQICKIVMMGDDGPEAGAVVVGVARQDAVRLEKARGLVAQIGEPQQARLDERAQLVGRLGVRYVIAAHDVGGRGPLADPGVADFVVVGGHPRNIGR